MPAASGWSTSAAWDNVSSLFHLVEHESVGDYLAHRGQEWQAQMFPVTARCHAAYNVGSPRQRLFGVGRCLPTWIVVSRLFRRTGHIDRMRGLTRKALEYNASMFANGQVLYRRIVVAHGCLVTEGNAAPTGPRQRDCAVFGAKHAGLSKKKKHQQCEWYMVSTACVLQRS